MDTSVLIYGGLLGLGIAALLITQTSRTATQAVPIPVRVNERRP